MIMPPQDGAVMDGCKLHRTLSRKKLITDICFVGVDDKSIHINYLLWAFMVSTGRVLQKPA